MIARRSFETLGEASATFLAHVSRYVHQPESPTIEPKAGLLERIAQLLGWRFG
jgi:hypothetical protein